MLNGGESIDIVENLSLTSPISFLKACLLHCCQHRPDLVQFSSGHSDGSRNVRNVVKRALGPLPIFTPVHTWLQINVAIQTSPLSESFSRLFTKGMFERACIGLKVGPSSAELHCDGGGGGEGTEECLACCLAHCDHMRTYSN